MSCAHGCGRTNDRGVRTDASGKKVPMDVLNTSKNSIAVLYNLAAVLREVFTSQIIKEGGIPPTVIEAAEEMEDVQVRPSSIITDVLRMMRPGASQRQASLTEIVMKVPGEEWSAKRIKPGKEDIKDSGKRLPVAPLPEDEDMSACTLGL